jgi:LysR family transcriptional regulator, low CO2-responsive transcriptional regulator
LNRLIPKIDTYHLIIFYYVAKEKSITAAAKRLFLSQPTVTNHIRILEEAIQLKLVRTSRKGLTLTCMGQGLYHYAEEIIQSALAADRFAETVRNSTLNIGVCSLFVRTASEIINDISEQQGQPPRISVKFGEPHSLLKEIVESKLDFAVIPNLEDGLAKFNRIKIEDEIKLTFYAGPGHPIFRKRSVKWTDVGSYPLIVGTEDSPIRKLVANKLISEGLKTKPKFYLTDYDIEFFKNIVRHGNFISLALKRDIEDEVKKGILKLVPLPDDLSVEVNIVGRKPLLSTATAKQFISYAKETFANIKAPHKNSNPGI